MILKLQPVLKDYIWGGTKLKEQYGKQTTLPKVAESWELSFCQGNESLVAEGEHCGRPISQVAQHLLGKQFDIFPVLVKLIDAAQDLSVQVHPSDQYALQHEGQLGKTEMWHILQAEEGAYIYLGLNQDATKQQLRTAIQNKTITQLLNKVPVKAGETYFVESGTLHAIGGGVTLIEIQQNSTLTYRVYDYDRRDADGKARQLHVEKALEVVNLHKYCVPNPARQQLLGKCKYFCAYKFCAPQTFCKDSFCAVTVVEGAVQLNGMQLNKGQTAFVSAKQQVQVTGQGDYILTCVE